MVIDGNRRSLLTRAYLLLTWSQYR
jgi:hypothetical protein